MHESSYCNYKQVRKDNVKTLWKCYNSVQLKWCHISVSHTVIMENITAMLMMITVN